MIKKNPLYIAMKEAGLENPQAIKSALKRLNLDENAAELVSHLAERLTRAKESIEGQRERADALIKIIEFHTKQEGAHTKCPNKGKRLGAIYTIWGWEDKHCDICGCKLIRDTSDEALANFPSGCEGQWVHP